MWSEALAFLETPSFLLWTRAPATLCQGSEVTALRRGRGNLFPAQSASVCQGPNLRRQAQGYWEEHRRPSLHASSLCPLAGGFSGWASTLLAEARCWDPCPVCPGLHTRDTKQDCAVICRGAERPGQ